MTMTMTTMTTKEPMQMCWTPVPACPCCLLHGRRRKRELVTTIMLRELSLNHPTVIVIGRNNRLHKERPQRIVSIKDHLARPESHHIARRCKIFGDAGAVYKRQEERGGTIGTVAATDAAVDRFLDDEDYLRVHLAGHMHAQRLASSPCRVGGQARPGR